MIETCAFCGKTLSNVYRMIQSPKIEDIYICDACAQIAYRISSNDDINKKSGNDLRKNWKNPQCMEILEKTSKWDNIDFDMTPREIHKELDRYIIGQEKAKRIFSVAIYNHNKRLHDESGLIKKSNILIAGPSGCGKTLLARTLAKVLNLPFIIADATSLTEAGYVGDDVESILQRLLENAGGNLKLAEKGVVYIDEIDKLARTGKGRSIAKDVSGEGVQAALLKLIEGSEVSVPITSNKKSPNNESIIFDTTNVLFLCGGAFEGLFDEKTTQPIGFNTANQFEVTDANKPETPKLTPEALRSFGLTPEFIGRFPILCELTSLTEKELIHALTIPEDSITKEYQILFEKDGIALEFAEDALTRIAEEAIKKKTGARSLRGILEEIMLNVMYDIPDYKDDITKCIITKECIDTKQPKVLKKRQRKKKTAVAVSS